MLDLVLGALWDGSGRQEMVGDGLLQSSKRTPQELGNLLGVPESILSSCTRLPQDF